MDRDDLTRWALQSHVEGTRQIGTWAIKCVLVALSQYANADLMAWPSADRLADDVAATRRDVRNALAALEHSGIIARAEKNPGRSVRWHLAGYPAHRLGTERRDIPPVEVAGNLAGHVAGNLAGLPARNRREEKEHYARTRGQGDFSARTMVTVRPGEHCAPHAHRLLPDGTCLRCDIRPGEAA